MFGSSVLSSSVCLQFISSSAKSFGISERKKKVRWKWEYLNKCVCYFLKLAYNRKKFFLKLFSFMWLKNIAFWLEVYKEMFLSHLTLFSFPRVIINKKIFSNLMIFAPKGAFPITNWFVSWPLNKALEYNVCCPSVTFSPQCVGNTQRETMTLVWHLFVHKVHAISGFELQEGLLSITMWETHFKTLT